jgi:uncharacterized protein (DUF2225 family)
LTLPAIAITTTEVEVICPVCHTKNKFLAYMSWGSYVYQYPSKFQLVFWPHTSSATIYSCSHCHLSLFMWDFNDFPKDRIEETTKLLDGVKLSGSFAKYTDIPASEKLLIAEKIYKQLGREDEFWLLFYRVLGYHFTQEKKTSEAAEARIHVLEIAKRMLDDTANSGRKKELLVITAAMQHFTGNDAAALDSLKAAEPLAFFDAKAGEEHSKNFDSYLSTLIKEFIPAIQSGKVPEG